MKAQEYLSSNNIDTVLTDALNISLTQPDSEAHKFAIIDKSTINIPLDIEFGVREVLFIKPYHVLVRITGVTTSGKLGEWECMFYKDKWIGWKTCIQDVDIPWTNLHSTGAVKYCRKNGIVYVVANIDNGASIASHSALSGVSNLPEGCRPAIYIYSAGTLKDYTGYNLQITVNPNGNVNVANLGPNTVTYYGGSLSFPVF